VIEFIQAMATDNVLWGAERIRGELLKLGIRVSQRTIQKYMRLVRPPGKQGQTWGTSIGNHSDARHAGHFPSLPGHRFHATSSGPRGPSKPVANVPGQA